MVHFSSFFIVNYQRVHHHPSYLHPPNYADYHAGLRTKQLMIRLQETYHQCGFILMGRVPGWTGWLSQKLSNVASKYYLGRRRNRFGHREWIGGATASFCIWNYMLKMIWVPVGSLWSLEKPSGVSAQNSHSMKTSAPVDLVFPTIWITYVQKCVYNKCKKSRNFRYDQMNDICWYSNMFFPCSNLVT